MRVGLITDSIEMGSPGLRRYAMRLAEAMLGLPGVDVTLLHRGPGTDGFYRHKDVVRIWDSGIPFAGKQLLMPPQLVRLGLDVLHDTYHFPPFLAPLPPVKVMTVADLTPLFMDTHRARNRIAHRLLFPLLVRRADHVVTISEYTRRDLIARLGVDPSLVTATPLAADPHLQPVTDGHVLAEAQRRLSLPRRFLLYVGTIEPRKNLPRVLDAFAMATRDFPDVEMVLAGPAGWGESDLDGRAASLRIAGRVRLLGRVAEEDLAALYSLATAFVYPSLYEGFGLPPLEAMQCGCPVITSNVSSLPEVVGDAALMVAPEDTGAIATAMTSVLTDDLLRGRLKRAGIERAAGFTWRRCAEQTLSVYQQLLDAKRRGARAA